MLYLCYICVKWERVWNKRKHKHKTINHKHRVLMFDTKLKYVYAYVLAFSVAFGSLALLLTLMREWKQAFIAVLILKAAYLTTAIQHWVQRRLNKTTVSLSAVITLGMLCYEHDCTLVFPEWGRYISSKAKGAFHERQCLVSEVSRLPGVSMYN